MNEEYDSLTPRKIEDAFNEIIKAEKAKGNREPSIKHDVWEEDGQKYSMWTIDTGKNVARVNDAGMELFDKAIKEWVNKK